MLRALVQSDLPQILEIERAVNLAPWTEETFQACLQAGYLGWAIEADGHQIVGFVLVAMSSYECHVLNVCVLPSHQHQGLGHQLMSQALGHAKAQGVGIAYLEVRRSNLPAISLYEKMNFRKIGERKNYYPTDNGSSREDALIFAKALQEISAYHADQK